MLCSVSLHLQTAEISKTIEMLEHRIQERFPGSGLAHLAAEIREVAEDAKERSVSFHQPVILLRVLSGLMLAAIFGVAGYAISQLRFDAAGAWDVLEGLEAAISTLVFLGAAVLFAVTMENRLRRRRVLAAIQELRELAHIVDMHQLTKDPESLRSAYVVTPSSPERSISRAELGRYLEYCSELLSLIGKVAIFYVRDVNDSLILSAVDDVEKLTTGLSRKIWQKMMILASTVPGEKAAD